MSASDMLRPGQTRADAWSLAAYGFASWRSNERSNAHLTYFADAPTVLPTTKEFQGGSD
jgi:hypothetical protein